MGGDSPRPRGRLRVDGVDVMAEQVRSAEQSGALRHVYGKPLDLSDDSPDWFMRKLLREEGFSLPLIERSKDIDRAVRNAEAIVERMRRRHEWLASPKSGCTAEVAEQFNRSRQHAFEQYHAALDSLNRHILDYNLSAPAPLQRRGFVVEAEVERVACEIPVLDPGEIAASRRYSTVAKGTWRDRVGRLLRGGSRRVESTR